MKEMKYLAEFKREVLDTGYCLGLLYFILNLGTHPTAYIKIPENSKYYGKDMEEIDLNVHGGVTYVNDYLYISENQKINGWFIGWDYGHYGDYTGYEELLPREIRAGGKKWSTKEIYQEVKEACYQIHKVGKTCENCINCTYIENGDMYCNEHERFANIYNNFCQTDQYMWCNGKKFIER